MKYQGAYWAVVPAAGTGSRMGADIPKQYLPLGDKKVIEHTLERLLANSRICKVFVAVSPADSWWMDCVYCDHGKVVRVVGGQERADSVLNALYELEKLAGHDDWVLVHDAARPCLRESDLNQLMDRLSGHPVGGILGTPLHDTVKRADPSGLVVETLAREELWRAFTPQMFRLDALRRALEYAREAGITVTDEAGAMEWLGSRPQLIEGHADNIKITRPEDLDLAAFYLERQRL